MAKYVIVTHKDLDGIAGASLYTYCKKISYDQLKIVFVEPSDLLKTIRKYYKKGRHYVIIDIGLNKDVFEELRYIDLSDVQVEWYDHHVWDDEWIKALEDKGVQLEIDRSTCATGVVAKEVCSTQEHRISYLAEVVCDADLWRFNRYESTFLFRYADANNSNHWREKVFKVIKSFLEGSVPDIISIIIEDVSKYMDEELKVLSTLRSKVIVKEIRGVSVCIFLKDKHIPSTSIIGNAMLSTCDIAIIVHETLKSLSFRSRRCNVREIAKAFGGGGHPRAAGAPLNMPIAFKLLGSLGIDVVRKRVVDEVSKRIENLSPSLENLCTEISVKDVK